MFNSVLRDHDCSPDDRFSSIWRHFATSGNVQATKVLRHRTYHRHSPPRRKRFLHGDRPVDAARLDEKFVQARIVAELDAAAAGALVIGDHFHGPAADAAAERQLKRSRARVVLVLRLPCDAKRPGFADETRASCCPCRSRHQVGEPRPALPRAVRPRAHCPLQAGMPRCRTASSSAAFRIQNLYEYWNFADSLVSCTRKRRLWFPSSSCTQPWLNAKNKSLPGCSVHRTRLCHPRFLERLSY